MGLIIESNKSISAEQSIESKSIDNEDEDEDEIIIDENRNDDNNDKQKNNSRIQSNNLRCRQCDYEAEDLPDLLMHRKGHASIKSRLDIDKKYHSDIENDDGTLSEKMFNYGMH